MAKQHGLHDKIREQLRCELQNYRVNDRLPTVRDWASKFGVSVNIASKAVRELTEEGLLDTAIGRGTFLKTEVVCDNNDVVQVSGGAEEFFSPFVDSFSSRKITAQVIGVSPRTSDFWDELSESFQNENPDISLQISIYKANTTEYPDIYIGTKQALDYQKRFIRDFWTDELFCIFGSDPYRNAGFRPQHLIINEDHYWFPIAFGMASLLTRKGMPLVSDADISGNDIFDFLESASEQMGRKVTYVPASIIQTFYDLGCRMKMEDDWIRLLEPERWREVYARLKNLVRKGIIIRKHELNRKGFSIQRFQDMVATGALDYVQMFEYDFCMGKVAESLATCAYPTRNASLIMPFMMFIDRASPHPEDCLRVLDFFLSGKVQRQLPERINLFPVDREELRFSSDGSVSFAQDYRCGLPTIVENSPLADCAISTLNWDISRHIDKNFDDPFGKFEIKQSFLRGQGNFEYASAKY